MLTRTIIVEDEPLSKQYISALLHNIPNIEIVDTAATATEAIDKINVLQPDLVLLDLELHSGTGLEVVRNILLTDTNIIFTTALDHQATRMIRISGMPFLQKPIDAQELEMLILHSLERNKALKEKQFYNLVETLNNQNLPVHIHIPEESIAQKTFINDIILIQSEERNCKLNFKNNSFMDTNLGIKDFEEMLCEYNFFRANVSTIINMNCIQKANQSTALISMDNGHSVALSLKKQEAFFQKLNKQ